MIGKLLADFQIQKKGGGARRIDLLSNQSTVMAFGGGRGIALKGHRAKGNKPQSEVRHEKTEEPTLAG